MFRPRFLAGARACLRRLRAADRCLLAVLAVLLVQSAVSLFCPASGGLAGEIDVIVRTSAASVFGCLLGADFPRLTARTASSAPVRQISPPDSSPGAPTGRIGFDAGEADAPSSAAEAGVPPRETLPTEPPAAQAAAVRTVCAAAVGLFCLAVLLAVRNLSALGVVTLADGAADTVVQFRDFVAGCLGFLIAAPARDAGP